MHLAYRPRLRAYYVPFLLSLFLVAVCNRGFWHRLAIAVGGVSKWPVLLAAFVLLVLACGAALSLVNLPGLFKPLGVGLLVLAAAASYVVDTYGVQIDQPVMQNVMALHLHDAWRLLEPEAIASVLLLGVLPAIVLLRADLDYEGMARHGLITGAIVLGSLGVAVGILLVFSKTLAPALREHRELRFFLTPTNCIQAVVGLVNEKLAQPVVLAPLGRDAVKGNTWNGPRRRVVAVVVVGEAARAMNFSLNGYERNTNPELSRQGGLVNFSNVTSCGTATAVSLPCIFSALPRSAFTDAKARSSENLLDVLSHAGIDVLWRDNNSGCKGVCDRVSFQDLTHATAGDTLCSNGACLDERLLEGLPDLIHKTAHDMVIVLHQIGSHGPDYGQHVPPAFRRFQPACTTAEVERCSREEIVAAYDNTILYTDHVLAQLIQILEQVGVSDGIDTSMMYFSSHGESLGERNLYLHGAPYIVAPVEQRQVPWLMWFSKGFEHRFHVDRHCLAARAGEPLSHDNIFHSVLGWLDIATFAHQPRLDIFNDCIPAT
ncbi:phosphoethanolamine transferase [Pseudoduganella violaceinigra]|uniref:phosphoethanolamine transferase n=1 Tax=Pseudoduganella violaceinigra TaxID=246602 RepID=UPI00054F89C3|nr:phosphoethanolamine--lipid A transferase [Pseudoduganella violaceinigra]